MKKIISILILVLFSCGIVSAEETKELKVIKNNNQKKEVINKKNDCSSVYNPVCGKLKTDSRCIKKPCPEYVEKTFKNKCNLEFSKAEFVSLGSCKNDILVSDNKKVLLLKNNTIISRDQILKSLASAKNEKERIDTYNKITGKKIGLLLEDKKELKKEKEINITKKEKENILKKFEIKEDVKKDIKEDIKKNNKLNDSQKEKLNKPNTKIIVKKIDKKQEEENIVLEKSNIIFSNLDKIISDIKKIKSNFLISIEENKNKISEPNYIQIDRYLNSFKTSINNANMKKNDAWLDLFEFLNIKKKNKLDLKIVQNKLYETKIYIKEAALNLKNITNILQKNDILLNK